ncbi:dihydrolipoamide acetyltransferase [Kineobactrum sediminis]|uniref:Dihydrolipoamide acetyltransferase component of pyruvate dehydrogenase complex n=1 Tax=Kineobactrum sediminis TaxID=1905677 RepID=A0A2N5XZ38_9GAMM|nr:2-oxo acid dehydrogenase subunit E2 [Kineobactrum sediminis]PLW81408.1 dihydrolipoamide acetyltransferase [Kineobactrum sediminis]
MSELHELVLPDIGSVSEVEIIELLVSIGDEVELEQALISVETDKATMEIPSTVAGRVHQLKVAQGDKIREGAIIALLELRAPAMQQGKNNTITPDTSSKTDTDFVSEIAFSTLADNAPSPAAEEQDSSDSSLAQAAPSLSDRIPPYSSPSIRRLARELCVHLPDVAGTGERGRITRDDVMAHVRGTMEEKRKKGSLKSITSGDDFPGLLAWPKVDFQKFGPVERRELSRLRKVSGANLHRNWVAIPHVTNHEDADITDLESFRVQMNTEHAGTGVKVTLLALLIKACVATLKKFPEFNASLDGDELVVKGYYHIGFAADTSRGLVVPVIRNADQKSVLDIADEVALLAARAREGKLTVEQMSGGCFSISSLGGIGGTYFTPIINAPEVAILGVSKARYQMIWNGQAAEPRLILPMSLSWDHRVIDGVAAAHFNVYLISVLTDLRRLIL